MLVRKHFYLFAWDLNCNVFLFVVMKVRIMKKRLVRKTFDMIEEVANRENKEVYWMELSDL